MALISLQNQSITVGPTKLTQNISLTLKQGQTTVLLGESGSGKSLTALSLMGLLPETLTMQADNLTFNGKTLTPQMAKALRGPGMGMIFQEPLSALNPVMKIGDQIAEVYQTHTKLNKKQIKQAAIQQLKAVQLPTPESLYHRYPHQLSGGQRQRVMIAMAMALKPQLLIADEPTTALDATVQAEILHLMQNLQHQHNTSILLITHDVTVAKHMADHIIVLEKGQIVEEGAPKQILKTPQETYTKKLLQAAPKLDLSAKKPLKGKPLLIAKTITKTYNKPTLFNRRTPTHALQNVTLTLKQGQTIGIVGESGSGKSTLAKCLLQLEQPDAGTVTFNGQTLTSTSKRYLKTAWRDVQMIFQDPFASLNPRQTIGKSIQEALDAHHIGTKAERQTAVQVLLKEVGLPPDAATRYPHQFSGGQRQRIVIARALALKPKLVIADEPVASLDVSIQHQVLQLMNQLKNKYKLSYLFISHDLRVVSQVADEVIVMHQGQVVEHGLTHQIFKNPTHTYTQKLLESMPSAL